MPTQHANQPLTSAIPGCTVSNAPNNPTQSTADSTPCTTALSVTSSTHAKAEDPSIKPSQPSVPYSPSPPGNTPDNSLIESAALPSGVDDTVNGDGSPLPEPEAQLLRRSSRRLQGKQLRDVGTEQPGPAPKSNACTKRKREDKPQNDTSAKRSRAVTNASSQSESETVVKARGRDAVGPIAEKVMVTEDKGKDVACDVGGFEYFVDTNMPVSGGEEGTDVDLGVDGEEEESGIFEPEWTDRADVDWEIEDIVGHVSFKALLPPSAAFLLYLTGLGTDTQQEGSHFL